MYVNEAVVFLSFPYFASPASRVRLFLLPFYFSFSEYAPVVMQRRGTQRSHPIWSHLSMCPDLSRRIHVCRRRDEAGEGDDAALWDMWVFIGEANVLPPIPSPSAHP